MVGLPGKASHGTTREGSGSLSMQPIGCTPWCSTDAKIGVERLSQERCLFELARYITDHNLNMSNQINRTSGRSPYVGFTINKEDIQKVFTKVNVKKSVGPDGVCSKLLKVCDPQFCQVFSTLFTWSLKDGIVPGVWKTSMICPIPKNNSPTELSDYRPIAITSVVMKCFDKIFLHQLLYLTKSGMSNLLI